ncbi:hypothetical protein [Microbacterium amylolyticum]|uniref:Multidrug efflux pump subunit AcrA (Membrane-fusion protein) n=1 Tax=Microbacterium amylolyticum TaxID=936337 RepID=A0ABS4ZI22_9MICO|nr:hypothetical protein [Microbacterium amylolyticum]MBP2436926.1 multidrug efflux pump subunit AcrA (membrane-fusion protein) [Microbacterium amylolyticum]
MEPFLDFARDYWWLVFPFGGAALGVVGLVSGLSSQQQEIGHKRKLELIEAKARARAIAGDGHFAPEQVAKADDADRGARLRRIMAMHDDLTRRWLEYELDVARVIAFPTMSDGRDPHTAAFLRAKKVADSLRPDSVKERMSAEEYAEYRDAVHDYEVAFDVAEQQARRIRDSGFTESERQRLGRAQQLLNVAVDKSATAAERQTAYRRVREELDGLIVLSNAAEADLKRKAAGELEA